MAVDLHVHASTIREGTARPSGATRLALAAALAVVLLALAANTAWVWTCDQPAPKEAASNADANLCMGNVQGAIDPDLYGVRSITVYPSDQLIDWSRDTDRLALAGILVVGIGTVVVIGLLRARSV